MLDFIRNKARSTVIQVIILAIVLVFVFWGVGSNQNGGPNAIATVNGEDVSSQKYQRAYEQIVDRYQQQFGGALPPELLKAANVKQQAIDQLIGQALMQQAAARAGLAVGNDEVRNVIEKMEAFQVNGAFNLERYQKMLADSRMTVSDFEGSIRIDLLHKKLLASLGRLTRVSDAELKDWFSYGNDKVRLNYQTFQAADFRGRVAVSDEKLTAFLNSHKDAYQTEAQIRLRFLAFSKNLPEAAQDPDLPFRRASEAYEAIIQSGSLEKYADTKGIAVEETGFFPRSAPPQWLSGRPELLASLFSLQKGELSSLLETADGFAIFFLDERKESQLPPLSEVRARVEQDFIRAEARSLARQAATAALARAKKEGQLPADAAPIRESGLFSRSLPAESGLPEVATAAGLKLGAAAPSPEEVSEHEDVFYVLRFKELVLADEGAFAGQREALRQALLENKRDRLFDAWLVHLKSTAKIRINTELLGSD